MKVLQLVTTRKPFFNEKIERLRERGVDFHIVTLPGNPGQRTIWEYLKTYPQVLYRSFTGEYDLVHVDYGLMAPFAILQPRRPIIMTLWGSDIMGKYKDYVRKFANYFDEVIVLSETMKSNLERNAHVITQGVDLEKFQPTSTEEARKRIGWDLNKKHVLFPYDPDREVKNYPLAESVVEQARKSINQEVKLHAVYDIPHNQIPNYMNASDVLLITSHREGGPNTVKEAMACNLPVVSTDVGEVRYRLTNVEPSFTCKNRGELISSVVNILKSNQRSNGRKFVQEFSLDQTTEKILDIYYDVI